ncbi:MAG: MarR family transcriptional regulator [Chloroflexota bacterium]
MSADDPQSAQALALQGRITAFVRAFGLLQPDETPCGRPIPVSEAHALAELDRDGPLPQHELGARLHLEKSTVSRLVDQLEGRGWLTGCRRDGDGRVVWLELTEAGRTAAAGLAAARAARFNRLLEAVPPDQRQTLLDSLDTLVEASRARP